MNKKFLAILVLLSVIPGCLWGPRYNYNSCCNQPRTTCVEAPAEDCGGQYSTTTCVEAPAESCYEDYQGMPSASQEYCYEDSSTSSEYPEAEYCYEEDYNAQEQYRANDYGEGMTEADEFDYDEFDA